MAKAERCKRVAQELADLGIEPDMLRRRPAKLSGDIMPAAVHLCASQFSSVHPTVLLDNTRVYTMPYGKCAGEAKASGIALGSLSLLQSDQETSLFPTGDEQVVETK